MLVMRYECNHRDLLRSDVKLTLFGTQLPRILGAEITIGTLAG